MYCSHFFVDNGTNNLGTLLILKDVRSAPPIHAAMNFILISMSISQ